MPRQPAAPPQDFIAVFLSGLVTHQSLFPSPLRGCCFLPQTTTLFFKNQSEFFDSCKWFEKWQTCECLSLPRPNHPLQVNLHRPQFSRFMQGSLWNWWNWRGNLARLTQIQKKSLDLLIYAEPHGNLMGSSHQLLKSIQVFHNSADNQPDQRTKPKCK